MGVRSSILAESARASDEDAHDVDASGSSWPADPFLQKYETERFDVRSEAVMEMMTGVIAVANLANLVN